MQGEARLARERTVPGIGASAAVVSFYERGRRGMKPVADPLEGRVQMAFRSWRQAARRVTAGSANLRFVFRRSGGVRK